MKTGLVALIVLVSCAPKSPPPPATNTATSVPRTELVKRAQLALRGDTPIDLDRPFVDKPTDREPTIQLFSEACGAGDHASCWTAFHMGGFRRSDLLAPIAEACHRGDSSSCRMLPLYDDTHRYPALAGGAARSAACSRLEASGCDETTLRAECGAGFPFSCQSLMFRLAPADAERAVLQARLETLAAEGCDAGIELECMLLSAEAKKSRGLALAERDCLVHRRCTDLGLIHLAAGRRVEARDAFERTCEYGRWACHVLGGMYVRGELPEPVPGRGQKLVAWGCTHPSPYTKPEDVGLTVPDCTRVE